MTVIFNDKYVPDLIVQSSWSFVLFFNYRKLVTVEKHDNGTFGFEIQVGSFEIFQTFIEKSDTVGPWSLQRKSGVRMPSDGTCDFYSMCDCSG